jgi:D-alanyl-D-alanine carboxypeptidase
MRKRYIFLTVIAVLLLGGCQKSSDQFLSYQEAVAAKGYDSGNNLSENDFFAKDLVIIPEEESVASDDFIQSEAALLVNVTDREAIYSKNVYEKLYPASLTKLFTALVAFKRSELTDMVTISYNASHIQDPGAKTCGFEEGDTVSLDALMNCMLVYSGNDAAIAIAEYLGGTEEQFVELMKEEAANIGAVHSNFVNSNGLHDENHYTTAYDIYLVFNELIKYDSFRSIINQSSYTVDYKDVAGNSKQKTFRTTNLYLRGEKDMPEGIIVEGGKTGTTYKAGNCLALLSKGSEDKDYISIILNAEDEENLYSEMTDLYSILGN